MIIRIIKNQFKRNLSDPKNFFLDVFRQMSFWNLTHPLSYVIFIFGLLYTVCRYLIVSFYKVFYELYFMYYGYKKMPLKEMKSYVESHVDLKEDHFHYKERKYMCDKMILILDKNNVVFKNPFKK